MRDEIGKWLSDGANRARQPEPDLQEVIRGGKRRRALRGVVSSLGVGAIVLAGWIGATALLSAEPDRTPPSLPPSERADKGDGLLVPMVMSGPSPGPDAAAPEDIEEARAVTVGFHALLFNGGYDLDYRDVERTGDASWRLHFNDGLEPDYLRGAIEGRRGAAEHSIEAMERARGKIRELVKEMRKAREDGDTARARKLGRQHDRTLHTFRLERGNIRALNRGIRRLMRRIAELERTGGPLPVTVEVERKSDRLVVTSVSSESRAHESAVGYSETIAEIDAWGADFYNSVTRTQGEVDSHNVEAHGFWTGPIPSSYEEKCLLQLLDEDGEVIWEQRDIHDIWESAPPSEDRRDGWSIANTGLREADRAPSTRYSCEMRS